MKGFKKLCLPICSVMMFLFGTNVCAKKYEVPDKKKTLTFYNQPVESTLSGDSIKVFVWNMYKAQKPSWKVDFESLIQNQDILVLQESYKIPLMENTFKANLDFEFIMASSFMFVNKEEKIGTGVLTASNTQTSYIKWIRTKYKEVFFTTPKVSLITKYKIDDHDKDLLVANIHAINAVPTFVLKSQLKSIAKQIQRHDGPVIWAGDFNTWSYFKKRMMYKLMKKIGLKEVKFDEQNDKRMKVFGNKIDFIFYQGLKYKNAKVYGEIDGSDHKAMSAEFSVVK